MDTPRDFHGVFDHNLDDKGRLVIPRSIRNQLAPGEQLYLVPAEDGCLELLPRAVYQERSSRRRSSSESGGRRARHAARLFHSLSDPLVVDKAGRLAVPRQLRQFAGIGTSCVVAGVGEWVEIWSEERWQSVLEEGAEALANPEGLADAGAAG